MTNRLTVECDVHFGRCGRGGRKELVTGPAPYQPTEPGRVPRVARLMALAIRCDGRCGRAQSRATPRSPGWGTSPAPASAR